MFELKAANVLLPLIDAGAFTSVNASEMACGTPRVLIDPTGTM